jgi:hypothetical protein
MVLKMDIVSFILGICVMYLVQKVYALFKIYKLNTILNKAGIDLNDLARYANEKANYNVINMNDKEDD